MPKVYDSWDSSYKSVFGALKRNKECMFTVKISKDTPIDAPPVMVLFRTGFKERFLKMVKSREDDYAVYYSTAYSAKFVGVHYYYFTFTINGQRHFIKKIDAHKGAIGEGGLFQLTVYDENYKTPSFLKGGIMYQIFPDRFCKSGKTHENVPSDRVLRDDWGGTPYYKPDANGHVWNNDYFGGDLDGIRSKLEYLNELGVTCIYLNPIFESHENHHYNTANYRQVDPLLGTNEDFRKLCEEAKEYGISVILDGVFSHTGADSIYFNKFNRYQTLGAYNSKESPYYPWYTFYDYPESYEAWWGIDTLPNVKENNSQYTEYICGDDGVLDYWISLGAAGYRLDVADELPDEFLDNLNKCVKKHGDEKIVIGEVWEDASNKESYGVKRRYLLGSQLDSVMNYPFKQAVLDYVKGGDPKQFRDRIMTIVENYPKPSIDVLMNFVSTHDVERAINNLGGENCDNKSKDWQAERYLTPEQYQKGKNMLKCAMALIYFLPGVPSIYYGDEVGMQGYKDPFNRRCFPWGNEDMDMLDFVKQLGVIRRSSKIFRDGSIKFLSLKDDVISFARIRKKNNKAVVIFINRSNKKQPVYSIPEFTEKYSDFRIIYGGEMCDNCMELEPYSYAVIKVEL